MAVFPRVWELIERFKDWCRSRGWRTREREDLVEAGGKYHNFLWAQSVNPSTFKTIVSSPLRCALQEGVSYRVVDISYVAWVLPDTLPEDASRLVTEKSDLSRRVAIYDLSRTYAGEPVCLRLNETDSVVFQEFERFLNREYRVKVRPIHRSTHRRPRKKC